MSGCLCEIIILTSEFNKVAYNCTMWSVYPLHLTCVCIRWKKGFSYNKLHAQFSTSLVNSFYQKSIGKNKVHLPNFFVHCGDCCVSLTQHGIVRTSLFYTVEYVSGQNKSFKGNVVLGTQFWSPQNRCVTIRVSP